MHWLHAGHSVVAKVVIVEGFVDNIACPNCQWPTTFHVAVMVVWPDGVYLFVRIRGDLRKVVVLIGSHGVQN